MFSKTAAFYDALYSFKNYAAEVDQLRQYIGVFQRSGGNRLLDVACGTGRHLELFVKFFECEGLDLDEGLLKVARKRLPAVPLHLGDMTDFHLGRQFDVVTCLFSAIGYAGSTERLRKAMACFSEHLVPGGVALIEPWFSREQFKPDTFHSLFVDEPDLKIARMNFSRVDGDVSVMDMHYLIATPEGIEHLVEPHRLTMFSRNEYMDAMASAGLEVSYQDQGITGRGLLIGVKRSL